MEKVSDEDIELYKSLFGMKRITVGWNLLTRASIYGVHKGIEKDKLLKQLVGEFDSFFTNLTDDDVHVLPEGTNYMDLLVIQLFELYIDILKYSPQNLRELQTYYGESCNRIIDFIRSKVGGTSRAVKSYFTRKRESDSAKLLEIPGPPTLYKGQGSSAKLESAIRVICEIAGCGPNLFGTFNFDKDVIDFITDGVNTKEGKFQDKRFLRKGCVRMMSDIRGADIGDKIPRLQLRPDEGHRDQGQGDEEPSDEDNIVSIINDIINEVSKKPRLYLINQALTKLQKQGVAALSEETQGKLIDAFSQIVFDDNTKEAIKNLLLQLLQELFANGISDEFKQLLTQLQGLITNDTYNLVDSILGVILRDTGIDESIRLIIEQLLLKKNDTVIAELLQKLNEVGDDIEVENFITTLYGFYLFLEGIIDEINDYIERGENQPTVSDISEKVKGLLEKLEGLNVYSTKYNILNTFLKYCLQKTCDIVNYFTLLELGLGASLKDPTYIGQISEYLQGNFDFDYEEDYLKNTIPLSYVLYRGASELPKGTLDVSRQLPLIVQGIIQTIGSGLPEDALPMALIELITGSIQYISKGVLDYKILTWFVDQLQSQPQSEPQSGPQALDVKHTDSSSGDDESDESDDDFIRRPVVRKNLDDVDVEEMSSTKKASPVETLMLSLITVSRVLDITGQEYKYQDNEAITDVYRKLYEKDYPELFGIVMDDRFVEAYRAFIESTNTGPMVELLKDTEYVELVNSGEQAPVPNHIFECEFNETFSEVFPEKTIELERKGNKTLTSTQFKPPDIRNIIIKKGILCTRCGSSLESHVQQSAKFTLQREDDGNSSKSLKIYNDTLVVKLHRCKFNTRGEVQDDPRNIVTNPNAPKPSPPKPFDSDILLTKVHIPMRYKYINDNSYTFNGNLLSILDGNPKFRSWGKGNQQGETCPYSRIQLTIKDIPQEGGGDFYQLLNHSNKFKDYMNHSINKHSKQLQRKKTINKVRGGFSFSNLNYLNKL